MTSFNFSPLHSFKFIEPVKIIAESGGTKTDWRILHKKEIVSFETINFHPKTIGEKQKNIVKELSEIIPENSSLYFFGSGCLHTENQYIIKELFSPLALKTIDVYSDLVAAGKAIHGSESGYVGILGTGSVFCKYSENKITDISGGYGYLLGDEGSGYYFGKLVLQKYLNNQLSHQLIQLIENKYGDKSTLLSKIYSENGKQFIGQFQLHSEDKLLQDEINEIHKENIDTYLTLYLPKNQKISQIGFVGSYAYHNQIIIKELLSLKGIELKNVIQKPIDQLMNEYFS